MWCGVVWCVRACVCVRACLRVEGRRGDCGVMGWNNERTVGRNEGGGGGGLGDYGVENQCDFTFSNHL